MAGACIAPHLHEKGVGWHWRPRQCFLVCTGKIPVAPTQQPFVAGLIQHGTRYQNGEVPNEVSE